MKKKELKKIKRELYKDVCVVVGIMAQYEDMCCDEDTFDSEVLIDMCNTIKKLIKKCKKRGLSDKEIYNVIQDIVDEIN